MKRNRSAEIRNSPGRRPTAEYLNPKQVCPEQSLPWISHSPELAVALSEAEGAVEGMAEWVE